MADPASAQVAQVRDKRTPIIGVLPKNAHALLLGGIAFVMVVVIFFSGRSAPKPKMNPNSSTATAVTEPSQARIQDYRSRIEEEMRKLAAEEAQLAQAKAGLRPPEGTSSASLPRGSEAPMYKEPPQVGRADADRNWIERDREKRDYQSLFASNIALTHRREADEHSVSGSGNAPGMTAAPSKKAPEVDQERGKYRLFEGTVVETVLTNRLESSFSGPINCMVTSPVYSYTGQKLLIPEGSRVLGEVKKLESLGEQRLAVVFHRLIMPDGFWVTLDQFKGLDQIGVTGLRDEVNHHYLQIFGASIAIGALAGLSQANTRYSLDESAVEAYRQGVAGSLSQSSLHILDRYLNVLPTFTIREGFRIKVYLAQDLMLPAYAEHPVRDDL